MSYLFGRETIGSIDDWLVSAILDEEDSLIEIENEDTMLTCIWEDGELVILSIDSEHDIDCRDIDELINEAAVLVETYTNTWGRVHRGINNKGELAFYVSAWGNAYRHFLCAYSGDIIKEAHSLGYTSIYLDVTR